MRINQINSEIQTYKTLILRYATQGEINERAGLSTSYEDSAVVEYCAKLAAAETLLVEAK